MTFYKCRFRRAFSEEKKHWKINNLDYNSCSFSGIKFRQLLNKLGPQFYYMKYAVFKYNLQANLSL